ncbi:GNAT family N-acetyltransferase [Robertkochia marina]|uniref:GNAT family N-acetyltransferase n=1 Tax=Robertkochia marina TaxID=1227945 RepID=A0A4S3LZR5_9FLAO|nr:GNAT family N-acetyltransferase [Robertkochia marina]THD67571.1 GNAT family N-acetyltransferase [Robertkochia marina]TRZ44561.1 GNAT family N-acetyltransferase [Robertkochia marina]
MIRICKAHTKAHLEGILDLQSKNLREVLSDEVQKEQGFLTVRHDCKVLEEMNNRLNHIIALDGEEVVGYALSMTPDLKDRIPVLEEMFERINNLEYKGSNLGKSNYYIMGQICIAEKYRGTGLFYALYNEHRKYYSPYFDHFITEVSASNQRSLRAHEKTGFKTILNYYDQTDSWYLILWDWNDQNETS